MRKRKTYECAPCSRRERGKGSEPAARRFGSEGEAGIREDSHVKPSLREAPELLAEKLRQMGIAESRAVHVGQGKREEEGKGKQKRGSGSRVTRAPATAARASRRLPSSHSEEERTW